MPVTLHWFLPTTGDSRTDLSKGNAVGAEKLVDFRGSSERLPTVGYIGQIARSAEQLGFQAALMPTSSWCEDGLILGAALSQVSERLRFLVALRPGLVSPTLAAQMAATFQRVSGNRLLLNVVTGGDDVEQRRFGDFLTKDERYERAGEYLAIMRAAWGGEPVDFEGRHYRVEGAHVPNPPEVTPGIYLGGSSAGALDVAARYADVYLTWGEPPAQVAEKLERVRAVADRAGRRLRFGIRLHAISRDTSEEAWAEADKLLAGLDPAAIERAQRTMRASQSEGQARMVALHRGRTDALEVSPNLWAGVGLVRGGAGTALVGSHTEVADRIAEYHELGLDEFILSGYPHLEEAYRVGEGVVPELRRRGLLAGADGAGAGGRTAAEAPAGARLADADRFENGLRAASGAGAGGAS
jgi:alkanesulfonate monooxygenase